MIFFELLKELDVSEDLSSKYATLVALDANTYVV